MRRCGGEGADLRRALTCAGVVLAACSSEPEVRGPRATVSDSAGIRIVTYDLTRAEAPVHRLLDEPELEIGVREGSTESSFSAIVDIVVGDDGSLFVSDRGSVDVRVFDAAGTFLRRIGREGEGPGEFTVAPALVALEGDTLFAFDARAGRLTRFLVDGEPLGTTSLRSGTGNRVLSLERSADGRLFATSRWILPTRETELHDVRLELDSMVVEVMTPEGVVVDTVMVLPDRGRVRMVRDAGGGRLATVQAAPPFLPRSFVRVAPHGLVAGHAKLFELDLGASDGRRTHLRVIGARHPADADAIRSWQEARIREASGTTQVDARTRQLNLDYLPEVLPAFADVRVSREGDVWVARSEFDASEGYRWLVFTPEGALRGRVHTPPDVQVFAIDRAHLVGVYTDELDVPYVRSYPLRPPRPR